jgi:hypothetical protein
VPLPQPAPLVPQEVAPSETPQVLKKWWFWTAVVVGATAVLLVLATRGPGQPSTRLGNMEAL